MSRPCIQPQEQSSNSEMLTSQPRTETYNLKPIAEVQKKVIYNYLAFELYQEIPMSVYLDLYAPQFQKSTSK